MLLPNAESVQFSGNSIIIFQLYTKHKMYASILINFTGATVLLQNVIPTTEPGNSAADTTTVDVCVSVNASGPIDLQQLVVTFNTVAGTAGKIVMILLGNLTLKPEDIQAYGILHADNCT